jgi:hypothetical protein
MYELGFYISEDDILHSRRREHLQSYNILVLPICNLSRVRMGQSHMCDERRKHLFILTSKKNSEKNKQISANTNSK